MQTEDVILANIDEGIAMGAYQRRKGHDWERDVARQLREIFPDARRGWQARDGGAEAPDVDGTPFHVECKAGAQPNLTAALNQALVDAKRGTYPVAICKRDREQPTVTMFLDDWLDLVREWNERAQ